MDWADEIALDIAEEIHSVKPIEDWPDVIAVALRKAKADGMRMYAHKAASRDIEAAIRQHANKIEKGEA